MRVHEKYGGEEDMSSKQEIKFKIPAVMAHQLVTAVKKEKEKYQACPVEPDLVPQHEMAQGWGSVVAGYFLVEQAFKALLHIREQKPKKIHPLTKLFEQIKVADQSTLRKFYDDFKSCTDRTGKIFPFDSLDDFLRNLDFGSSEDQSPQGSLDWRYFLIAEGECKGIPTVSVEYMHEIVFACTMIIEEYCNGTEPTDWTKSGKYSNKRPI